MIHVNIPFDSNGNLGAAYNRFVEYIPRGDWACFIDHDAMFTTNDWFTRIANIQGLITSNGENDPNSSGSNYFGRGGGSGGMIWLEITELTLSGALTVTGGDGWDYSSSSAYGGGGGGGGGRISVITKSFIDLDLLNVTDGEGGDSGNGYPGLDGEDGVIYYLKIWLTSDTHPDEDKISVNPSPVMDMNAIGDIYGYFYDVDQNPDGIADNMSNFTQSNSVELDSLADGDWYFHAVPMDSSFNLLEEQHMTYHLSINAAPLEISSPTHPNQNFFYNSSNPVFNLETLVGIDEYYYILDENSNTVVDENNGVYLPNYQLILPGLSEGTHYLHIVGLDDFGFVGSNVSHFQINIGQPQPTLSFNPVSIDFQSVIENSSTSEIIIISNLGNGELIISNLIISDTTNFSIDPDSLNPITEGGSTNLTVIFTPQDTMVYLDTLTFITNDPNNPEVEISLQGTGLLGLQPIIAISSNLFDFGDIIIDEDSTQILTISNVGDGDLIIESMVLSDENIFAINPFALVNPILPGNSQDIEIIFSPQDSINYSESLIIHSNDDNSSELEISLMGAGLTPPPVFVIDQDSLIFGTILLGEESDLILRLRNYGVEVLTVELVLDSDHFNVNPGYVEIPAYSLFDAVVYFTPLDTGVFVSQITALSNSPEVPVLYIDLIGQAVMGDTVIVPNPFPVIDEIADMPQDQGGYVGIMFSGSDYDCCYNAYNITEYSIWRELDITMINNYSGEIDVLSLPSNNHSRTDSSYWEYLGEIPAVGFEYYGFTAGTIMDSSEAGYNWNNYLIIAHTPNPDILFISEPDSGYSVDNLSPAAPGNLVASIVDTSIILDWDENDAMDLDYYTVYRSTDSELIISEENLLANTTDTLFTDMTAIWNTNYFYQLTCTDYNGNVSGASNFVEAFITVNYAPTIDSIDDIETNEDTPVEIEITVNDENGDSLSITVMSSDENVTPILEGYTLNLNLTANWHGTSEITVTVSDGEFDVTEVFVLNVISVNDTPADFSLISPVSEINIVLTNDNLTDTLHFEWSESMDVDGDSLTYEFESSSDISFLGTIIQNSGTTSAWVLFSAIAGSMETEYVSGTWSVLVTDGIDTVDADNAPFTLTLDGSALAIDPDDLIPDVFALHQNYPNPFNPVTTLRYDLPENSHVNIMIYDIMGREVRSLVNNQQNAGFKSVLWDATNESGQPVSAGMYIYRISAGDPSTNSGHSFHSVKKMILLK